MNEQQKQRLEQVKAHIIEAVNETMEMYFMDVEHMGAHHDYAETVDWLSMHALYAEILILHPFPAALRLIIPQKLATQMAQNIYALEEEPSKQLVYDLVAETINVIAGRLMASILPPHEKFKIGIPELSETSFLQAETFSIAIDFDAEGFPLWLIACGEGFLQPLP